MSHAAGAAIVICTHNRLALLRQALASIAAARRPHRLQVEVVVVANACTDGTVAWLEEERQGFPYPLRILEEPQLGKVHALNRALGEVDASALAFVDDDQRLDQGYLEALEEGLLERQEELLCGRILPDWTGTEPAWVHDPSPLGIRPLPIPVQQWGDAERLLDGRHGIPGGGNLVVRRKAIDTVGPFVAALGPRGHNLAGGEDLEWVRRALGSGLRLRYVPRMLQWHHVDPQRLTLPYLMRKAYQRSQDSVLLRGVHARGVPAFLYRKLAGHAWRALTCLHGAGVRHYLVRCAATWGEIAACRRLGREGAGR